MTSPISEHDNDPGDETQRNFRYQHAYGVILLSAAFRGEKPYSAIWCEYHEDLLCERDDGLFDGFQIKTRRSEIGDWSMTDDALRKSIKRFVSLIQKFDQHINHLVFVSNTEFQSNDLDIKDRAKLGRSPVRFFESIRGIEIHSNIPSPFDKSFQDLRDYCECTDNELFTTLKKVHLTKGPSLDSFDAEIAHNHLPHLEDCENLSRVTLNKIRDELIFCFYSASSLTFNNPSKQWSYIGVSADKDPVVQAKKIDLSVIKNGSSEFKVIRYTNEKGKLKV